MSSTTLPSVRRPAQPPPASQSIFAYTLLRKSGMRPASASGTVAPFPPRPGANGSRRYPGNPNQVAGRLRLVDQLPFGRRQTATPAPAKNGPRSPASAAPRRRSSTCSTTSTAVVRPNRASGRSRQRIPIIDRPRRFAVRQPPLRGARQRQRLPSLVVRVVELRDIDPLRRLARQERRRAARRRAYRARGVNNSSSIPRLSRDCPLYVFPPESLHRRHEPTPSGQGSSTRRNPLTLLPSGCSSRGCKAPSSPENGRSSAEIPSLAATAYRISTASGEIDRHRHVRTAGRRRRTGHLVDLEQSRGPSAGQPTPHWTECIGGTGSPRVRERADQHVPPPVQPSHQRPRCPMPDTLGRWQSKTTRPTVTRQAGGADGIWRPLKSAKPVTPRRASCAARA